MKRTALKKKSKQKISTVQNKLWDLCKAITRLRHGNKCYTCPQSNLIGSNWHTGHMWPKASLYAPMKYDLRILRPQCYNCNMNLGGMGAVFYVRMLDEIGKEKMAELEKYRQFSAPAMDWYLKLIPEYQQILKELQCKK